MVIITHRQHSGKAKLQILSLLDTLWVKKRTASLNLRYHTVPASLYYALYCLSFRMPLLLAFLLCLCYVSNMNEEQDVGPAERSQSHRRARLGVYLWARSWHHVWLSLEPVRGVMAIVAVSVKVAKAWTVAGELCRCSPLKTGACVGRGV